MLYPSGDTYPSTLTLPGGDGMSGPIMFDGLTVSSVKLGDTAVTRVYVGDTLIYGAEPTAPVTAALAWPLDAGTGSEAVDKSGNGHTGYVYAWDPDGHGTHAYSAVSDGTASASYYAGTPILENVSSLTMMAWYKPSKYDADILTMGNNQDGDTFYVGVYWPGKEAIVIYRKTTDGASQIGSSIEVDVPLGTWAHFALVVNEGDCTLYVNGQSMGGDSFTGSFGSLSFLTAGGYEGYSANNGSVNDVRIFDRALTAQEITTMMDTPL